MNIPKLFQYTMWKNLGVFPAIAQSAAENKSYTTKLSEVFILCFSWKLGIFQDFFVLIDK